VRTRSVSPPILSSLLGNTAAMATAGSLNCCARRAGQSPKRVERIWQREGLKVPYKQPKRGRLWLTNGSCIRLRPEQRNHVWSYDFVEDRTRDGRKYRMRRVHPRMSGDPCRRQVQGDRCDRRSVRPVHPAGAFPLTSGPTTDRSSSPRRCRTGSRLSVPRRLHRREAQIVIESWRRHYNTIRPHASIGYKLPAPEVFVLAFAPWPAALRRLAPPATLAQRPTLK
jgi:hypothetical protein